MHHASLAVAEGCAHHHRCAFGGTGLLWLLLAGCSSEVALERGEALCSDGRDNDGDQRVDCDDPDCRALPRCAGDAGVDLALREAGIVDQAVDRSDLAGRVDRALADALPLVSEQEPNGGESKTEFNAITVPTMIAGVIGTADDADIFGWTAAAGDRLAVVVQSAGTMEPHLAIFGDSALGVPPAVNDAPRVAGEVLAEYYVLASGAYFLAVRDRRNVSGSAHLGGPGYGYTVSVLPLSRAPLVATVGGEVSSTLSPPGTVGVFAFTAAPDDELSLTVLAHRLSPPSGVDSRLSLFHPGEKAWLGTNADLSVSELDSLLEGKMPFAGTYHAIVENEGAWGSSLGFTLQIGKK